MDTKSKSFKPFVAWFCFTFGVGIISLCVLVVPLIGLITGYSGLGGTSFTFREIFIDYKDGSAFKIQTRRYFNVLLSLVAEMPEDIYTDELVRHELDSEGENLRYYAINQESGFTVGDVNGDMSLPIGSDDVPNLPDGYDYCWYFDGEKVRVVDRGEFVDTKRLDSGYAGLLPDPVGEKDNSSTLTDIRVLLAVKNVLTENPYGYSNYYRSQQYKIAAGRVYIGVLVSGVVMFTYGIVRRQDKRAFDRNLAAWSGKIWFEGKVILSLVVLIFVGSVTLYVARLRSLIIGAGFLFFGLLWFYIMFNDLLINRRRFFTHNSINSALTLYRNYEKKYSWQKKMLKRAYALVAAEAVLTFFSVLFMFMAFLVQGSWYMFWFIFSLLLAGIGLYLISRYMRRHHETVSELGFLIDHIEKMKDGDMAGKIHLNPNADIYHVAQNLNSIQNGMNLAVSERLKSERMKIDLITNVSHDLKTPLTSIVSYVELLGKEIDLEPHVRDYIGILAQKTERLKYLIQDLFDLSKATSKNIVLDTKRLDLVRLIDQAIANMQESIDESGLTFKIKMPEEPVYIQSDGTKLSRVFQNLISNTLKYSLLGSRVFIDLVKLENAVLVIIKNTANYEMDFDEDEILERFARGDRSRSTEGSGLGLSIAKSFTEACGGKFDVRIDGDQFRVEIRFKN